MITLITGAHIYSPEDEGVNDVLIVGNQIAEISREIDVKRYMNLDVPVDIISGEDKILTPGFIDPHVHLIGGGGEGGYHTRTPETHITDFVDAGITTAVGLLGTDKTSRHLESLYAKTKALTAEGMTALMYTGNYQIPTPTITGSIEKDIYLIDTVIGTAEIAISDHRSSQPTTEELSKIVAETRIGGMTSNKAGVTHFHTGGGRKGLTQLFELVNDYDLPAANIYPTHVNRTDRLIQESAALTHLGVTVDMTVGSDISSDVAAFIKEKGNTGLLTLSSDGNGSLPVFNSDGSLSHLDVARPKSLFNGVVSLIKAQSLPAAAVLKMVTENTAGVLKFENKGRIQKGMDADILLFDRAYTLDTVISRGTVLKQYGKTIVRGTFDRI